MKNSHIGLIFADRFTSATNIMKIRILVFLCTFLTNMVFAQSPEDLKIEKRLEVLERYYDDGDYEKGRSKTLKQVRKYAQRGFFALRFQPLLAKFHQANGDFNAFEKTIERYLKNKSANGAVSESYGRGLVDVAELYAEYGNPVIAEKHLEDAKNILASKIDNGEIAYRVKIVVAKIQYQKGEWIEFEKTAREIIDLKPFDAPKEFFDEAKQVLYMREAKPREVLRRKTEHLEMRVLLADALRQLGRYSDAEKELQATDELFKSNEFSNKNQAYILKEHVDVLLMIEQGKSREAIRKKLEKALYFGERTIGLVHRRYMSLHKEIISYYNDSGFAQEGKSVFFKPYKIYLDTRYPIRNRKHRYELRKSTNRYFGKNNINYAYSRLLDALREQQVRNFRSAEKILVELHKNTELFPKNHPARRDLLNLMIRNKISLDKLAEAQNLLEELRKHSKEVFGEKSFKFAETELVAADFFVHYSNRFDDAENILKKVNEATKNFSQSSEFMLRIRAVESDLKDFRGNLTEALQSQIVILADLKTRFDTAHVRYTVEKQKLLQFLMRKGSYESVEAAIEQILKVYEREGNVLFNIYQAEALEIAAQFYATMGLYSEAQDALLRSNRKFAKTTSGTGNSSSDDELAKLYIQMGRFYDADRLLKKSIETRETRFGDESRFLISPYREMANLQMNYYGNYVEADKYIGRATEIAAKIYGEESVEAAQCLAVSANMANAIGDFAKAAETWQKVIEIKSKSLGEKSIDLASNYLDYAVAKFNNKEPQAEVDSLLEKSMIAISSNIGMYNPAYAQVLKSSAKVYLKSGQRKRARMNLEQSQQIWEKLSTKNSANRWEINHELALVLMDEAEFAQAEKILLETSKNFKKIFGERHPKYIETLSDLAKLYFIQNSPKQAFENIDIVLSAYKTYIKESFPALSEREKSNYWNLIREKFEFYNNLVFKFAPQDNSRIASLLDNALLTKTLLLGSSVRVRSAILNSNNDSLINNYNQWILKQELYGKVLAMSQEQRKQEQLDPQKIKKEIETLNKILTRQSEAFVSDEQSVIWQQVQAALNKNEYAVEMIRYRTFDVSFTDSVVYSALILKGEGNVSYVNIPSGRFLETKGLTYYKNVTGLKRDDRLSYQIFWKPIDDFIPNNSRIFFSAEGAYTQINPEGLMIEDEVYVIDRMEVVLVGSTGDLVQRSKTSKFVNNNEFVIIGNPKFYSDVSEEELFSVRRPIPQLKGAEQEALELKRILSSKGVKLNFFLRSGATEDTLRTVKNPRVFHIATHGFFEAQKSQNSNALALNENATFDNPLLRSGLMLSEAGDLMQSKNYFEYNKKPGVLTAYEVVNLNFDNTELVVLSACETGKGDVKEGDGVFGLQRAFFVAGAKSLIMSLFKVDDEATKKLMLIFYQKWLETGDRRKAFYEAKKELRKEYEHPYYWASFVMLGL